MPNPSPTPRQHFNSRPSARGDSHAHRSRQQTQKFQFTPLREGRRIRFKSTIFPSRDRPRLFYPFKRLNDSCIQRRANLSAH